MRVCLWPKCPHDVQSLALASRAIASLSPPAHNSQAFRTDKLLSIFVAQFWRFSFHKWKFPNLEVQDWKQNLSHLHRAFTYWREETPLFTLLRRDAGISPSVDRHHLHFNMSLVAGEGSWTPDQLPVPVYVYLEYRIVPPCLAIWGINLLKKVWKAQFHKGYIE